MSKQGRKKTLCETIGHQWEPTMAPNFRKCSRSTCHAVQCLHRGRWVYVASANQNPQAPDQQAALWSDGEVYA